MEQDLLANARQAQLAWIGLGANLGDRLAQLQQAVRALHVCADVSVTRVSPLYRSVAHTLSPHDRQPDYFNAVVEVTTTLAPQDLLAQLHLIEQDAGRERLPGQRWQPRPLDLDLLVMDRISVQSEALTLPHPRVHERRFVLQPLADLAPSLYVPAPHDAMVADLLAQCPDKGHLALVATDWVMLVPGE